MFAVTSLLRHIICHTIAMPIVREAVLVLILIIVVQFMYRQVKTESSCLTYMSMGEVLERGVCSGVLGLKTSCDRRISSSRIMRISARNIRRLRACFKGCLPRLFCDLVTPLALFLVLYEIDMGTDIVLLVYIPLVPVSVIIMRGVTGGLLGGC